MMTETETQTRLRRAKDALAKCRETENELRKALAAAVESTRAMKERVERLFALDQDEQCKRLRTEYRHVTK